MLRTYWAELTIVFGCAAVIGAGFAFEHKREPFATATESPAAATAAVRALPALGALKRNARDTAYSIDTVTQDASPVLVGAAKPTDVPLVADRPFVVTGWAADGKAAAAGVYVLIDGDKAFPATYGLDRPDVAAAMGGGMYPNAGFTARIPAGSLAPGRHTLALRIVDANRTGYYAGASHAALVVRDR